jgi:integrase
MTRYPRSGKGRKWTTLELKSISKDWHGDTVSDGGGLSGEVRVNTDASVSIRFKYAFKWLGKVNWHQCGTWPLSTMDSIRSRRDDARQKVKEGVNPNDQRKADRIEAQAHIEAQIAQAQKEQSERLTFSSMFEAWMQDGVSRADNNAELRRMFEKDILPDCGQIEVKQLTDSHLREALRKIGLIRNRARTAERMLTDLRQLFRWAEKRKPWRALLIEGNPAALVDLKLVVQKNYTPTVRDRVLSSHEIRELRDVFVNMKSSYEEAADRRVAARPVAIETQIAMWLCLSTACRIGELLKSRWDDVDLKEGVWSVPKQNTKTKVEWTVYLSDFALRHFKSLREISHDSEWCFPALNNGGPINAKTMAKQIGDRQFQFKARKQLKGRRNDNSLVLSGGQNGEWTPHDLRRTAATMMQTLGVPPDLIDRCQNHVMPGSKVRRHYLHYDFAKEKRDAWQRLGKQLDVILGHSGDH